MPSIIVPSSAPVYSAPAATGSNGGKNNAKSIRNTVREVQKNFSRPEEVTYTPAPKVVQPMSPVKTSLVKKFVGLFSLKTVKNVGPVTLGAGVGIAGGAAIAIFAGPAIHSAFVAMAASSVFPPVMIAIGATLGAALLAFGIYKLVQRGRAKLAAQKEAEEALVQQAKAEQGEAGLVDPFESEADEKQSIKAPVLPVSTALKSPAVSVKAPTVTNKSIKAEAPEANLVELKNATELAMNEEARAWGA